MAVTWAQPNESFSMLNHKEICLGSKITFITSSDVFFIDPKIVDQI